MSEITRKKPQFIDPNQPTEKDLAELGRWILDLNNDGYKLAMIKGEHVEAISLVFERKM